MQYAPPIFPSLGSASMCDSENRFVAIAAKVLSKASKVLNIRFSTVLPREHLFGFNGQRCVDVCP